MTIEELELKESVKVREEKWEIDNDNELKRN